MASYIIVPQKGFYDCTSNLLLLDLGSLKVWSNLQKMFDFSVTSVSGICILLYYVNVPLMYVIFVMYMKFIYNCFLVKTNYWTPWNRFFQSTITAKNLPGCLLLVALLEQKGWKYHLRKSFPTSSILWKYSSPGMKLFMLLNYYVEKV